MSKKKVLTEAWGVYTKGDTLTNYEDSRYNIFKSRFEADIYCLKCKWTQRTLDGYKVVRVEI